MGQFEDNGAEIPRRSFHLGAVLDTTLIQELARPGFDSRHGVNFICRPSPDIADLVLSTQERLRRLETGQYYYPPADLHFTLFEVSHSLEANMAAETARVLEAHAMEIFKDLPRFTLRSPVMAFDERACAVRFTGDNERLAFIRSSIRQRIADLGIALNTRETGTSAHVTIMRYVKPLATEPDIWINLLNESISDVPLTWTVSEVWLTWGATWFGMRSRISERGPYSLR